MGPPLLLFALVLVVQLALRHVGHRKKSHFGLTPLPLSIVPRLLRRFPPRLFWDGLSLRSVDGPHTRQLPSPSVPYSVDKVRLRLVSTPFTLSVLLVLVLGALVQAPARRQVVVFRDATLPPKGGVDQRTLTTVRRKVVAPWARKLLRPLAFAVQVA